MPLGKRPSPAATFTPPESFGSQGLSIGSDTKKRQLLLKGLFVHTHFITASIQGFSKGAGVRNPVITDRKLLGGHHINMMLGNT